MCKHTGFYILLQWQMENHSHVFQNQKLYFYLTDLIFTIMVIMTLPIDFTVQLGTLSLKCYVSVMWAANGSYQKKKIDKSMDSNTGIKGCLL